MKIDWGAMIYIVGAICLFSYLAFEYKLDNDVKMKHIEYCIEMKIQNCPEVK